MASLVRTDTLTPGSIRVIRSNERPGCGNISNSARQPRSAQTPPSSRPHVYPSMQRTPLSCLLNRKSAREVSTAQDTRRPLLEAHEKVAPLRCCAPAGRVRRRPERQADPTIRRLHRAIVSGFSSVIEMQHARRTPCHPPSVTRMPGPRNARNRPRRNEWLPPVHQEAALPQPEPYASGVPRDPGRSECRISVRYPSPVWP